MMSQSRQQIQLLIPGIPRPAGSKRSIPLKNRSTGKYVLRANGAPVVNTVDANPKSREWKSHVSQIAAEAYQGPLLSGPIYLKAAFIFPRPKSHFRTGKYSHLLKDSAPAHHIQKPDRTKLLRGLEDALTGIIWRDDCQVVTGPTGKVWGDQACAMVMIHELEYLDGTEGTQLLHAQEGRAEGAEDESSADVLWQLFMESE